jgi:hypothetical protein
MNINVRFLTRTAVLLALALAIQALRFPAQITGIAINAILFSTAILVHPVAGIVIGLITPWIAVVTGIMALAFMAPFIMAANASLVLVFWVFRKHSHLVAVVTGALAKYAFFILTINVFVGLIGKRLPPAAIAVFGFQQLLTALAGGLLALVVYHTVGRSINR